MTTMARFLVLWGTPEDPDYFERHYREIHVPLVKKLPGVRRLMLAIPQPGLAKTRGRCAAARVFRPYLVPGDRDHQLDLPQPTEARRRPHRTTARC